jgi:hypothetical protein
LITAEAMIHSLAHGIAGDPGRQLDLDALLRRRCRRVGRLPRLVGGRRCRGGSRRCCLRRPPRLDADAFLADIDLDAFVACAFLGQLDTNR